MVPAASSLHPISVSSVFRCVMRKFQHILYLNENQTEPNYTHSSPSLLVQLSFLFLSSSLPCALSGLPWVEVQSKIAPGTGLILWSDFFFSPKGVCEKEPNLFPWSLHDSPLLVQVCPGKNSSLHKTCQI